MSEPGAIRQRDLFSEQGIKPADMKRVRDELLTEEDWYKEGTTIWIRPSGQMRLRIAEEDMSVAQHFVELRVIRPARNRRFVLCRKQGEGDMKACLIPSRFKAEQFVGKTIRAEEIKDASGERSYQHESLAVS